MNVASADEGAAKKAIAIIQELTATPELDKSYLGRVERITDFGAFVEIMPGVDGLLHVSEIALHRVKEVRDELKEGDQLLVKVINIEPSTGKVRPSRKALLIEAALPVDGIERTPVPWVWQRSLNDSHITYELNCVKRRSHPQLQLYSELHQEIQDAFARAGGEVLSPK